MQILSLSQRSRNNDTFTEQLGVVSPETRMQALPADMKKPRLMPRLSLK